MNLPPLRLPVRIISIAFLASSLALAVGHARADQTNTTPKQKERELIKVLQSKAAPDEKAIACKRLAIYGTTAAVPALATLLSDEKLASWARIPLEAIPGSAPDKALRDAIGKLHGNLLVGVINSIGVRRDPGAVNLLAKKLNDPHSDVASAAAESLGRIGGVQAAKYLKSHLATGPSELRSAAAEGCIRCAEHFMADGKYSPAVELYDFVRQAEVPEERVLEATRGAILARQSDGLPLLLEQLRSSDKAMLGIGLRTARELPGPAVTTALAAEMRKSPPDRQPLLLLALAEREDPAAFPAIYEAARSGPKKLRLTAVSILERSGDPASLPVLLDVASDSDPELALAAKSAIGKLPGVSVDKEIINRLSHADARSRPVLFDVAARRGIESATPTMLHYADNPDAASRRAALAAVGNIGGDRDAAALVAILESQQDPGRREDTEKALLAIASRRGSSCASILLPLARNPDPDLRLVGLRTLAAAGGPDALAVVRSAIDDKDENVREEAVQTLASWPNTWPEDAQVADPLLALAQTAEKPAHQILALRGYLQFLLGDDKLKAGERFRLLNKSLPLLTRPEEKRLAIAVARQIPTSESLDLLVKFAAEPAVAEDAGSAIIAVATKPKSELSKSVRRQALQGVIDRPATDALKQKAQDVLAKLN